MYYGVFINLQGKNMEYYKSKKFCMVYRRNWFYTI